MCTASWLADSGGFELFFNRDERRSRPASLPPREYVTRDGMRYLAPLDAEAGGTWIAVNEAGLIVCLLNRYPRTLEKLAEQQPAAVRSRGEIVHDLIAAPSSEGARGRLGDTVLTCYRPFTVLLLEAGSPAMSIAWDDQVLIPPLSLDRHEPLSSSAAAPAALANRAQVWRSLLENGHQDRELHFEFHRSHLPEPSALSVCMHRPEAATESFCHIRVTPGAVTLAWTPGPPCARRPALEVVLARSPGQSEPFHSTTDAYRRPRA